jgi:FkbM family methyltransferase
MTYKGGLASELDRRVFFLGAHEKDILNVFQKILSTMDSPVVVDVGANAGHHSLFFSRFASQVHSFEPWRNVREQFLLRLKDNNIQNVKVYSVALGSQDESRAYFAPSDGNLGTGSFLSSHYAEQNQRSEDLQIVNGDEYFRKNGISKVNLIKIDVEGWEWFVLLGLSKTIERCRPVVLFEYSESTKESLRTRSQLDFFTNYEMFLVLYKANGARNPLESIDGESLPFADILLIPAEIVKLLLARPDTRSLFSKSYRSAH